MLTRLRSALVAGTGLMLIGGGGLALAAGAAAAAPSTTASPTAGGAPSASAAPSSSTPPRPTLPGAASLSATPVPSRPVLVPQPVGSSTGAGIAVPAGNAGVPAADSDAGLDATAIALFAAGAVLVVGGATVTVRRHAHRQA